MSFGEAIATCFRKYGDFSGRASRPEYWWFALFQLLVTVVLWIITIAALGLGVVFLVIGVVFLVIWSLGTLLPNLAVAVRRLHDSEHSGGYWFMVLIPFVGPIILLVFLAQAGTPGRNLYGPPPGSAPGGYAPTSYGGRTAAPYYPPAPVGYRPAPHAGPPPAPFGAPLPPLPAATVRCPYCAEQVQAAARVCRWCGRDLPELGPVAPSPSPAAGVSRGLAEVRPDGSIAIRLAGLSAQEAVERVALAARGNQEAALVFDLTRGGVGGEAAIVSLLEQVAALGAPGTRREITLLNPNDAVLHAARSLAAARHWGWHLQEDGIVLEVEAPQ